MSRGDLKWLPGIYKITCNPNGRVYIGQSVDCPTRWAQHLRDLLSGEHANTSLQEDWSAFGLGAFSFTILERESDSDLRLEKEQSHIKVELARCYNVVWDEKHIIRGGVIVNTATWKPLDPSPKPPAESQDQAKEGLVEKWFRLTSKK
jgi:hypothetical protein